MRIGFALASSLAIKQDMLYSLIQDVSSEYGHTVILLDRQGDNLDYIDVAISCGTALYREEVDFILTGCSSGLGMQLACNYVPGIICGYGTSEIEATLFARINQGNAFSYPFALNWGWASEVVYRSVLHALFKGLTQAPYPQAEAERKQQATDKLKWLKKTSQLDFEDFINAYNTKDAK